MSFEGREQEFRNEVANLLRETDPGTVEETAGRRSRNKELKDLASWDAQKVRALVWGSSILFEDRGLDRSLSDLEYCSRIGLLMDLTEEKATQLVELLSY